LVAWLAGAPAEAAAGRGGNAHPAGPAPRIEPPPREIGSGAGKGKPRPVGERRPWNGHLSGRYWRQRPYTSCWQWRQSHGGPRKVWVC
jgi:hypothetical protein